MSVCVWTFAFVAAFGQSVQEFDECGVGENVGMESVSFAGPDRLGARDFGRAQDGRQGERHPERVIFIGAAPIIFGCCTYLASGQAGSVVSERIDVNYVRNYDGEGGENERQSNKFLCPDCVDLSFYLQSHQNHHFLT